MPPPSALLRLLAFAAPAALVTAALQPLMGATVGAIDYQWALSLSVPGVAAAAVVFAVARWSDRGDGPQPPWYSAWALLPGAFILAGAAAMCIFGALVEFSRIATLAWLLLATGTVTWSAGLVAVRRASR